MDPPELISWIRTQLSELDLKSTTYRVEVGDDAVKLVQHLHEVSSIIVQLEQELLQRPHQEVQTCLQILYETFNDASEALSTCQKVGPLSSIVRAVDLHALFQKCAEQLLGVLRALPVSIPTTSKPLFSALANCEFSQLQELEEWNEELRTLLSRKSTRKRAAARLIDIIPGLLETGLLQFDRDLVKSDLVVAEAIEEDEERAFLKGLLRAVEYATDPSRAPAITPSAASSQSTPHSTVSHQPFSPTSMNGDGMAPNGATLSAQGSGGVEELREAGATGGSLTSTRSFDVPPQLPDMHAVRVNGRHTSSLGEETVVEEQDGTMQESKPAVPAEQDDKADRLLPAGAVDVNQPAGVSEAPDDTSSFDKSSSGAQSTIPARLWCPEDEEDTAHTTPIVEGQLHRAAAPNDTVQGKVNSLDNGNSTPHDVQQTVVITTPAQSDSEGRSSDIASTSASKAIGNKVGEAEGVVDAAESAVVKAPSELLDPMTCLLMRDPVILVETGMTFDRSSIEKWLAKAGNSDPSSGAPLQAPPLLVPNVLVKRMVDSWLAQHEAEEKAAQHEAEEKAAQHEAEEKAAQPLLEDDKPAVEQHTPHTKDPKAEQSQPQDDDVELPMNALKEKLEPAVPQTEANVDNNAEKDALVQTKVAVRGLVIPGSTDENVDPYAVEPVDSADEALPQTGTPQRGDDSAAALAAMAQVGPISTTPTRRSGKLVDGSPLKEAISSSAPATQPVKTPSSPLVEKLRNFNASAAADAAVSGTPKKASSRGDAAASAANTPGRRSVQSGFTSAASTPERRSSRSDIIVPVSTPEKNPSQDHGTSLSRRSSAEEATTPDKIASVRHRHSSPAAGALSPASANGSEETRQRRSRYGNRFAPAIEILNKEPNLGSRRTHSNSSYSSSDAIVPASQQLADAPSQHLAPATPVPSLKLPSTQVPPSTAEHVKPDVPMGGVRMVEAPYPVVAASSDAPRLSARGLFGRGGGGSGEASAKTDRKGPFSSAFRSLSGRGSGSRESDPGAAEKDSVVSGGGSTRSAGLMELPDNKAAAPHKPAPAQPAPSQEPAAKQRSAPTAGPPAIRIRHIDDSHLSAIASESTQSDSPKIEKPRRSGMSGSMMRKFSRSTSATASSAISPPTEESDSPPGHNIMMSSQSIMNTSHSGFHDATSKDTRLQRSASNAGAGLKGTWLPGSGDTPLIKAIKSNENKVVMELLSQGADPNQVGKGMMKQGDSPLIKASKRGNIGAVQLLLKFGASPNLANRKGNTPLELAVESNHLAMVHALLAAGANPNTRTASDHVPLIMLAAWHGNEELVRALIACKVDVNAAKPRGGTALHSAALQGFDIIVSLLLAAGADVHKRNQDNSTPLFNAAMKGHTNIVKMLIKAGSDVNTAGKDNMVPVEVAIEGDFFYVLRELVEAGASVNAQTYEADAVPMIMLAAWKGNKNIVKMLVSKGADVNQKKTGGGTALHAAALQGHSDIVWLLLMAGGYVHAKNQDGNMPLHNAARKGQLSSVARLVEGGADVNAPGRSRMTPLHAAVAEVGNADVVKLLLKTGADTERVDKNGWQPLHYAAANDFWQAAEMLARHPHCQVNAPEGIDNQTALFIAAKSGHTMTAKVLLKAGANPMARTKIQGNTPLHAAMVGEHYETIRVLVRYGADPYAYNVDGTRPVDVNDHENCRKAVQAGLMDRRG